MVRVSPRCGQVKKDLRVQLKGIPLSVYPEQTPMSPRLMVFPKLDKAVTVATSECDDLGDSKSVVAMTILDPTGQATASCTVISVAPGAVVPSSIVQAI
mmetsp:Transcript_48258/g.114387  ORF Transcript_48258/g.114387 Transcript_48258/m.114387 type:complete len:99 (+) Transcript_48258:97-393(+)